MTLSNKTQNAIAIVTARGGSKRIPGKNIRIFHGKPLISWTIHNLLTSQLFSRVIVSTDSTEIASIAVDAGAEVPFLRPAELADDFATTADVAQHAIDWLLRNGVSPDSYFCIVYPAAVGVTSIDLADSLALMKVGDFDLVFAGCEYPAHPSKAWFLGEDSHATAREKKSSAPQPGDLRTAYHGAGQFYWSHQSTWSKICEGKDVRRGLYVISRLRAIDINSEEDWALAELLFANGRLNEDL